MSDNVREMRTEPTRLVAKRAHVTFETDDLGAIIGKFYGELYRALPSDAGTSGGQNIIVYQPDGPRTATMIVGLQWDGDIPEDCEAFELAGGAVAHLQHVGPYSELPAAHRSIHSWMRRNGYEKVGMNWEVYGDWNEDPSKLVTDVCYLL